MAPSKTANSRIKTKVFFINDVPQLLFEERSIVGGSLLSLSFVLPETFLIKSSSSF